MPYVDLYNFCQDLSLPISRRKIKPKLLELTNKEKLAIAVSSNLKAPDCRGLFLSINSKSDWVKQNGCDVIVLSRDIFSKSNSPTSNYCMERFITIKEMMHLFDDDTEACDSGESFDQLVAQFVGTEADRTPQFTSEIRCFWRALGLLCPEDKRLEFIKEKRDKYEIALLLRMPEQYVENLFTPSYLTILEKC